MFLQACTFLEWETIMHFVRWTLLVKRTLALSYFLYYVDSWSAENVRSPALVSPPTLQNKELLLLRECQLEIGCTDPTVSFSVLQWEFLWRHFKKFSNILDGTKQDLVFCEMYIRWVPFGYFGGFSSYFFPNKACFLDGKASSWMNEYSIHACFFIQTRFVVKMAIDEK